MVDAEGLNTETHISVFEDTQNKFSVVLLSLQQGSDLGQRLDFCGGVPGLVSCC